MRKPDLHWTESLFDSVYALYETAREYQLAHQAAQITASTVDFDRRRTHPGRIALTGRSGTSEPHGRAQRILHRLYYTLETETRRQFEEAALLYASGTAWAVRAVLNGEHPAHVAFQTTDRGDLVPPSLEIPGLDTFSEGPALDAAYDALVRCMQASEYGEDLADQDYISDHEAGQMHAAWDVARGTAAAAFTYGLLAQRALNFALLEPCRAREREIALARATAAKDETPGESGV
ncbi:hypothetical protein NW249_34140 [Streptomyces sp. OUCMDZ-4982]|uniref:hypothetical protein n=1 Tax=Streptomyces sp. OUCMDZ-4982 TaxID=2973090 RepID=UPI00215BB0D9|nr:hypothetical protein [Streptomyces sp. OUCMDZ-4982]MCR8947129.1 hypothetical protein [Streptomyces sp. OUCMDZ-4982]